MCLKQGNRVANSTVEYSAFNRLVPGSNPGRPIEREQDFSEALRSLKTQKGFSPHLNQVFDK
jgi:hypothetical protein